MTINQSLKQAFPHWSDKNINDIIKFTRKIKNNDTFIKENLAEAVLRAINSYPIEEIKPGLIRIIYEQITSKKNKRQESFENTMKEYSESSAAVDGYVLQPEIDEPQPKIEVFRDKAERLKMLSKREKQIFDAWIEASMSGDSSEKMDEAAIKILQRKGIAITGMNYRKIKQRLQSKFGQHRELRNALSFMPNQNYRRFIQSICGSDVEAQNVRRSLDHVIKQFKQLKKPLKVIILGEAPLSDKKYFYNNPRTFLNGLRVYFELKNNQDLLQKMLEEGILLLDLYEFPLPTVLYDNDNDNKLFDEEYFSQLIAMLKELGLIDEHTLCVYRYKKLAKRRLEEISSTLRNLEIFKDADGNAITLFEKERPQVLHSGLKKIFDTMFKGI